MKWSNTSNEPVSFKSLSCVPLDGLKSACDLVTVFSTGNCPKAPESSSNSRNLSQNSNSSNETKIFHGESVSMHGSDCDTSSIRNSKVKKSKNSPNSRNASNSTRKASENRPTSSNTNRTESNAGTVYSGSVSTKNL